MAQNTSPIFSQVPRIGFGTLTGNIACVKSDGVGTWGTDLFQIFLANSVNGSYVSKIRISAAASAATAMTASVIRLFISTILAAGGTTAADTVLFQEVTVAAVPAANASNGINYYEVPCDFALPAGYNILASIQANCAANTRWQFLTFGGDY